MSLPQVCGSPQQKSKSRFEQNRLFVLNDPRAPRLCPALAEEIGLNESIMLLQLEFWIALNGFDRDGSRWARKSVRDIRQEFSFWSVATINRILTKLEDESLVLSSEFNDRADDRTRSYLPLVQARNQLIAQSGALDAALKEEISWNIQLAAEEQAAAAAARQEAAQFEAAMSASAAAASAAGVEIGDVSRAYFMLGEASAAGSADMVLLAATAQEVAASLESDAVAASGATAATVAFGAAQESAGAAASVSASQVVVAAAGVSRLTGEAVQGSRALSTLASAMSTGNLAFLAVAVGLGLALSAVMAMVKSSTAELQVNNEVVQANYARAASYQPVIANSQQLTVALEQSGQAAQQIAQGGLDASLAKYSADFQTLTGATNAQNHAFEALQTAQAAFNAASADSSSLIGHYNATLGTFIDSQKQADQAVVSMKNAVATSSAALAEAATKTQTAQAATDADTKALGQLSQSSATAASAINQWANQVTTAAGAADHLRQSTDAATQAMQRLTAAIGSFQVSAPSVIGTTQGLGIAQTQLAGAMKASQQNAQQYFQSLGQNAGASKLWTEALDQNVAAINQVNQASVKKMQQDAAATGSTLSEKAATQQLTQSLQGQLNANMQVIASMHAASGAIDSAALANAENAATAERAQLAGLSMAAAMDDAGKKAGGAKTNVAGLTNQIVGMGPALSALASSLAGGNDPFSVLTEASTKANAALQKTTGAMLKNATAALNAYLQSLGDGAKATEADYAAMGNAGLVALTQQAEGWVKLQGQTTQAELALAKAGISLKDIDSAMAATGVSTSLTAQQLARLNQVFPGLVSELASMAEAHKTAQQAQAAETAQTIAEYEAWGRFHPPIVLAIADLKTWNDAIEQSIASDQNLVPTVDVTTQAMAAQGQATQHLLSDLTSLAPALSTVIGQQALVATGATKSALAVQQLSETMLSLQKAVSDNNMQAVAQSFQTAINQIKEAGTQAGASSEQISSAVKQMVSSLEQAYPQVAGVMQEITQQMSLQQAQAAFKSADQGLSKAWKQLVNDIVSGAADMENSTDIATLRMATSIKSNLASSIELINALPDAFGNSAKQALKSVEQWINFGDKFLAVFSKIDSAAPSSLGKAVNQIVQLFHQGSQESSTATQQWANSISQFSDQFGDDLEQNINAIDKYNQNAEAAWEAGFTGIDQASQQGLGGLQTTFDQGIGLISGSLTSLVGDCTSATAGIAQALNGLAGPTTQWQTVTITATQQIDAAYVQAQMGVTSATSTINSDLQNTVYSLNLLGNAGQQTGTGLTQSITGAASGVSAGVGEINTNVEQGVTKMLSSIATLIPGVGAIVGVVIGMLGSIFGGLFGGSKDQKIEQDQQAQQAILQTKEMQQQLAQQMQQTIQSALTTFQDAMTTLDQLADFTRVPQRIINEFFVDLNELLQAFAREANQWTGAFLAQAKAFADAIGPIVKAIANGVTALDGLLGYIPVTVHDIDSFVQNLQQIETAILNEFDSWGDNTIGKAKKWANKINDVVQMIGTAVQALDAIGQYGGTAKAQIQLFVSDLGAVEQAMVGLADSTNNFNLKTAQRFSDKVDDIVKMVSDAVTALESLSTYTAVLPSTMSQFVADLQSAVNQIGAAVQNLDVNGVGQASTLSSDLSNIFQMISSAVQALTGLDTYAPLPVGTLQAFSQDMAQTANIMAQISQQVSGPMMTQASTFASDMNTVFGMIQSGTQALTGLSTFVGIPVAQIQAFAAQVQEVIAALNTASQSVSADEVAQLQTFASRLDPIFTAVSDGVAALNSIETQFGSALIPESMVMFAQDVAYLVQDMIQATAQIGGPGLAAAAQFATQANSILSNVQTGMQTIAQLGTTSFTVVPSQLIGYFVANIQAIVGLLESANAAIGSANMTAVSTFMTDLEPLFTAISDGITAFNNLGTLSATTNVAATMGVFAQSVQTVVADLQQISGQISGAAMTQATNFANSVATVLTSLQTSVNAFNAISTFAGVMPQSLQAFEDSVEQVLTLLNQLVAQSAQAQSLAQQIAANLSSAAASISGAAQSISSMTSSAASLSGPQVSTKQTVITATAGASSGGGSVTHFHQYGGVTISADLSKVKSLDQVQAIIETLNALPQTRRAGSRR